MPHYEVYEKTIELPNDVAAELEEDLMTYRLRISGPKGSLEKDFDKLGLSMELDGNKIKIYKKNATKRHKRVINTYASKIKNMITGVTKGWRYELGIFYKHYPMKVSISGNEIIVENYKGEKKPRRIPIIDGVEVKIDGNKIIVTSIDIEKAGTMAGLIEQKTRPTRNLWDIRKFWDGIYITKKKEVVDE